MRGFLIVMCFSISVYGQRPPATEPPGLELPTNLHNGLTERIGNFSIELLYHTSAEQPTENLIMSPITVWTVLGVLSEGASGNTAVQINNALRISSNHRNATRSNFESIYEWLQVNTTTVELAKVNAVFMDINSNLERDYRSTVESIYRTRVIPVSFANGEQTANTINDAISKVTHGRIPKLVQATDFDSTKMILTSALYFKGQWTVPFNATYTKVMPFYNNTGQKVGEVNMMYNRFTYPFSNIPELQARVIEMPYGKENRLSMLIMLPNHGVSLENMFFNFAKVPLDKVFQELRVSKEEFSDDEVDCYIPRFKIESSLDLTHILKNRMGIADLFDSGAARLPHMARTPLYVSKVIHKAEIEVTEDGTTASGVTAAELSNRIGPVSFVADRPFCYMIVEKVTNSIVFGGLYVKPSLS